jgi:hypothetical protein
MPSEPSPSLSPLVPLCKRGRFAEGLLCADIVAKVPKSAAVDFSPKNETIDSRRSMGLQTRYKTRL